VPAETSHISTTMIDKVLVARVEREKLGDYESPGVQNDVTQAAQKLGWRIALDLSPVGLLSSSGLGLLLTLSKLCKANSGKLVLFGVKPEIMAVMKVTKVDRLFTLAADQAAAVRAAS
jgi:anti-sigma B factor antagonist